MAKRKSFLLLIFFSCFCAYAYAQNNARGKQLQARNATYGGFGIGIDYGGLGAKLEVKPVSCLGVQLGLGYIFFDFGFNVGLSFYPLPKERVQPFVSLLYGYNARIISDWFKETYYGFSPGVGGVIKVGKRGNKLTFEVFAPIRNNEFKEDAGTFNVNVIPITVSLGFNFLL